MRPHKFVKADESVSVVKTHDHIHISSDAKGLSLMMGWVWLLSWQMRRDTEFGVVNLEGLALQERLKRIISIAHPEDWAILEEVAFNSKHYCIIAGHEI